MSRTYKGGKMITWDDFKRFKNLIFKYMQDSGEGETKASQLVTAYNKLVYKWFNDGDVYDNTYFMEGWLNDLSSYANWLYKHTTSKAQDILKEIETEVKNDNQYESLLFRLGLELINEEYLEAINKIAKVDSIYDCDGEFTYEEYSYEEEDY